MRGLGKRVPDAMQLHLFAQQFTELLVSLPPRLNEGGQQAVFFERIYGTDRSRDEWRHRVASGHDATFWIEQAIRTGALPLWSYFDEGPVELDFYALAGINHHSIASGIYRPMNRPDTLDGAPLWVKKEDAKHFTELLIAKHYPEIPAPKSSDRLERDCEQWLEKQFAAGQKGQRADFKKSAQTKFPGLSGRQFDRAWSSPAQKFGRNQAGRPSGTKSPRK